jgi:RNA polymerase sigma-70 factor (ECF subfamily)
MSRRSEPTDAVIDALLDRERNAAPPDAALNRVWARVVSSVPIGATAAPAGGASAAKRRGNEDWIAAHARGLLVTALALGGAIGAGAHALFVRPPPARIVYVDRPAPPAAAPEPPTAMAPPAVAIPAAPPAPAPLPAVSAARTSPQHAAAPPPSSLAAERAILDDARSALSQGDGARALALADAHARRFAPAQLDEEREALAVQALVIEGRYDDARARAARFRAAWPHSLFLPSVEASLASIP